MVTPIFFWGEHWGSVCCHLISFGGGLGVTTVTPFVLWGGGKGGNCVCPPPGLAPIVMTPKVVGLYE